MTWSLRNKLYFAFGTLLALVAALGALTLQRLSETGHQADEQSRFEKISHGAERLATSLEQARRHELSYFTETDAKKALKAHSDGLSRFEDLTTEIRQRLVGTDVDLSKLLTDVSKSFGDYKAAHNAAADAYIRRGTTETGAQGEFRKAAHEIEAISGDIKDLTLTVILLEMRRSEKDFLLRNEAQYVDKNHAYTGDALAHIKLKVDNKAMAEKLTVLINNYRHTFDNAVAAIAEFGQQQEILKETSTGIEAKLATFVAASSERADQAMKESAETRHGAQNIVVVFFSIAMLVAFAVARLLSSQINSAVKSLAEGTRRLTDGDLGAKVLVKTRDEFGDLAQSFNTMATSMNDISRGIGEASASVNTAVKELQATVSEQGAAIQQQASSVSETVATVEELTLSAQQVSDVAVKVMEDASTAMNKAEQGRNAITQSVSGMNNVREQVEAIATTILELSEKTQQIGSIIATVDDFAEQSSLLALNASIEAARAGEDGKAFSVVAAEVKALAEQSQSATERVRGILNDIQRATHTAVMVTEEGSKRVDRGVDLVTTAGSIISDLAQSMSAASDSAKQIAAAARQQNNGIGQIAVAMAGIDQFSKQNVEAIRQTEGTAQGLAAIASQLNARIAKYRVA